MRQRRLVAAIGDVVLGARGEAELDGLAGGKILGLDNPEQQVEIALPMPMGAVADRRLGDMPPRTV